MAGKPGRSGGYRTGAGRKRKLEKYQSAIEKAELDIGDNLPRILQNLYHLADGGYERVEEEWQPAKLVTITKHDQEKDQFYTVPAFPDKEPDEMVLVKRKVSIADKDRTANQYLVDRVMGKPKQRQEITGADGGGLEITVSYADDKPDDS